MDHRGRSLDQILSFDDRQLEAVHDYIQWLFPLREPSPVNPSAPVFTAEDVAAFRADPALGRNMLRALDRMLRFYGLAARRGGASVEVERAASFAARAENWLTWGNHNFLRLTRILKSLHLAGLSPYSDALLRCLSAIRDDDPEIIGDTTWSFWRDTAHDERWS